MRRARAVVDSNPSDESVGGKRTAEKTVYVGPRMPPMPSHHYTWTLIAADLDPKAL
jgi:phosphatidylethanolamine-binding protein (PEBP) family uncharacterized protein